MKKVKKVVLAYSGGLDTSVILKWLQDTYGCEVITFTADIGQGEELEPARKKAKLLGVKKIFIEDLREEFVRDFVFPMFRANALYEGEYLLGTSIARPLIAKHMVEIAKKTGADAISHGATGKGNDQVRFELGAYALMPDVRVIAPWREWDLLSREKLLAYADKHGIPVDFKKRKGGGAPYSMDANLLHISYEGGVLEDPNFEPEESMWRITSSPEKAPNKPEIVDLEYVRGDIVAINGKKMSPAKVLTELNRLGGKHGVGRLDLVENRSVGMKSRGCYETPGGTIMLKGHRAIESLTLDREVVALKDDLMPRYARLVYAGYWFSPERKLLQTLDRHLPGARERPRVREALQGHRARGRALLEEGFPLRFRRRDLRGRPRRLQPGGRRGLHQAERAQAAHRRQARAQVRSPGGTMPSFDIVCEANLVEVKNAVEQANKEITNRFDFKGTDARVEQKELELTVYADDEFKLGQVRDVLHAKFAKRGVDARLLTIEKPEKIGGDKMKQLITVKNGVETELAKKIVKMLKDGKLKVTASIQGDAVRVSSAKRDTLQEAIALVRSGITEVPLTYQNFRD